MPVTRGSYFASSLILAIAWLASGSERGASGAEAPSAALSVGAATVSITPDMPVPLMGQMNLRVSKSVDLPVTATALALETRRDDRIVDQAIFVTCELCVLRGGVLEKVRQHAKGHLAGFDLQKLVLNATHTHSAPAMITPGYDIPKEGVMQPAAYLDYLVDRIVEAADKAWTSRRPASAGWGLGHAVIGQNRRVVYADGHAQMYGKTDTADFRGFEGYEDHGVEALFFWDANQKLIATAINVACPAQEVESNRAVSSDYWGEVRKLLRARHGDDLAVLGWIAAAGDQSPHLMYRKAAEERMRTLRGWSRLEELAHRIDQGWEEAYQGASKEKHAEVVLSHAVSTIQMPPRKIRAEDVEAAKVQIQRYTKSPVGQGWARWNQEVLDRYEKQQAGHAEPYEMELHALRLGDIAIATNSFELFADYGVQIKSRSPALQTFVIQLAGEGTYLPSERAVRGGGYSAVPQSNSVGPEGGQILVERSLDAINAFWPKQGK